MFRWWKLAILAVGAGVVIGSGVIGWMYFHRDTGSDTAAEKPGTESLSDDTAAPSGSNSASSGDSLRVTNNGSQGFVQGQSIGGSANASQESTGGSSNSGDGSATNTNNTNQLPTPSQFHVYDQYKNNPTALYIDFKPGDGKAVAKGSTVTIQYRGWLTDGKEFDESYASGKPFTFKEGDGTVITGMAEAVFGMKAGGQRRLIIPPTVGYGAAGHDPIPPDAVMIFDVELVSVQ